MHHYRAAALGFIPALLFVTDSVYAQATCPAVNFLRAAQVQTYSTSSTVGAGGLYRQEDGSFALHRFQVFSPYRKNQVIANFQDAFASCTAPRCLGTRPADAPASGPDANRPGAAAQEVAFTDLIGDGTVAIFGHYSRLGANVLSVGYSDAAGNFKMQRDHTIGPNTIKVLAARLKRDGRPDALAIRSSGRDGVRGSLSVLLNDGVGNLGTPVEYTVGFNPLSMTARDINGDGNVDVAVLNYTQGVVSLFLGNGNGSLQPAVELASADRGRSIVAEEVTGDGNIDLIIGTESGMIVTLPGNGNGTFRTAISTTSLPPMSYLAAGDFNKDGRLDLAANDYLGGTTAVFLGDGAGKFTNAIEYMLGYRPEHAVILDFDSDGNQDIAIASGHANLLAHPGTSDTIVILYGRGDGSFIGANSYSAGQSAQTMTLADFNGDNRMDIVTGGYFDQAISVFLNSTGTAFQPARRIAVNVGRTAYPRGVSAADFNRDGRADIAVTDFTDSVLVFPGGGDGSFAAPARYSAGSKPLGVASADFDGDGRPDLAVANSARDTSGTDSLGIFLNPAGGFAAMRAINVGSRPSAVVATDLNADGRVDIAVANYGTFDSTSDIGGVAVLLNSGSGNFAAPVAYPAGRQADSITSADVNGDTRPDLLVTSRGPNFTYLLHVLLNNGDGTFRPLTAIGTDFGPTSIAAADYNGDGKQDMLVTYCCGDTDMAYLLGKGDGNFEKEVHFSAGDSPTFVIAHDFNSDGKPDAAVASSPGTRGVVSLLVNASVSAGALGVVSAASSRLGPVAPESIVTAYGANLAAGIESAPSVPLPLKLAGAGVAIRDAQGQDHAAPLFFASPGQLNFLVPGTVAIGSAIITTTSEAGAISRGTLDVVRVAPGLFTSGSAGVAAANVLTIKADGTRINSIAAALNSAGTDFVTAPIDLGDEGDQVFVLLYGTGIRLRSGLGAVRLTVGGVTVPVTFAGAQGTFPGLDQLNIQLPRSLAGRGDVDVQLTVDGVTANIARLGIR